ncbi:MAG: class I SAM-dependent rRNA methyltransferase, partial [Betaproteobacteria bacterium]|nr:class I SAM-dependent rRNA methyltransferase [Betaproteobacteria bacterium]
MAQQDKSPAAGAALARSGRNAEPALILKAGRERSLRRLHPWVFSGAVDRAQGATGPGETVCVRAADGAFLAWAAYSPASQIRARVWSFAEAARPDEAWLRARVSDAVARRSALSAQADALRLVHAESDGLPGVVADRYGELLVVQLTSAGAERWRDVIVDALRQASGCSSVFERSDGDTRALEGLPPRVGLLPDGGGAPQAASSRLVEIRENGIRYRVDVAAGQKTGFFLDQRDSRAALVALAAGRDVLNCFCYTGGFTLSALVGRAASVLSVDSSAPALALAQQNLALNGLDAARASWADADVFSFLRALRRDGRTFDLIVLDPPKFAPTSGDAERASRGYKDINLNALKLLRPGGRLATFSCSSGISADLF